MRREKSRTGLKSTQWPRLPDWTGEPLWTSNDDAPLIVVLLTGHLWEWFSSLVYVGRV